MEQPDTHTDAHTHSGRHKLTCSRVHPYILSLSFSRYYSGSIYECNQITQREFELKLEVYLFVISANTFQKLLALPSMFHLTVFGSPVPRYHSFAQRHICHVKNDFCKHICQKADNFTLSTISLLYPFHIKVNSSCSSKNTLTAIHTLP